jgi:hypothetical protein
MRKLYALLFTVVLFAAVKVNAQITVTNPTNTTPNLLASYTTLASVLTDLNNVTAMSGPVKFTIAANYSETAPADGFTIGSASLNAVLSATNTVTITKASGTVTLNAGVGIATPTSVVPDGILKLVGADYITIDGLTFNDGNASNPSTMEYAIGLFKRAAGDGCNNNTIQNCTINLPNTNNASATAPMIEGSVGILVINALPTAATTSLTPTNGGTLATNGTNSNNKFYNNTINGGNYGIGLSGFAASTGVGPTPTATTFLGDLNNDIGGSLSSTGNSILNFGGVAGATNPCAGIRANNQWSLNISYNTVNNNNGSGANHVNVIRGIYAQAGLSANVTISYNNVTVKGGGTTSQLSGIENAIGSTAAANTVNMMNNSVTAEYTTLTTTAVFYPIFNSASAATVNILNNKVSNTLYGNSSSTGTGTNYLIYNTGAATNLNIIGDTVMNHLRVGTTGGIIIGIYTSSGTNQTVKKNFINNLAVDGTGATSTVYGIQTSTGTVVCDSNTVKNLRCIKTTGTSPMYGIYNIASPTNENYNYNLVDSLTNAGTGITYGIYANTTTGVRTVSNNTIRNVSSNGTTIAGIYSLSSSPSIFKNKIYNISSTNTGAAAVSGIILGSLGTSGVARIYNNLISDLYAPNANSSTVDLVRGINITSTSAGNVNVYFNTIYLNAVSSGADFSTSGIYHASSSSAGTSTLDLQNNIIVNTSTATGGGTTVALRRNGGATAGSLANFATTSNYNLYYVGIPVGNNYIYFDGTNAANTISDFQLFSTTAGTMAPRGSASVSEDPEFQSVIPTNANFLKYKTTSPKQIESGGINISGITDDYIGTIRQGNVGYSGTGSAPDIGAWELNGIGSFTCTTPAPGNTVASANNLCLGNSTTLTMQNATAGTGVSYQWQSSTNGTSYSNISGANGISYTATPTARTYYRCAVTCQNGPSTVNSTAVQVTFSNSITSKTDSARCGTGSVVLKATGNSGTTIKWYADSTGGAAIGTGSPFNTPSIATTTKYYASAENIAPGDAIFGTSTNTNATTGYPSPYSNYYGGAKHQMLIKASELAAAGVSPGSPINSITFTVASVGSTFAGTLQDFQVDMGLTTSSVLTATAFLGGLTNVIPAGPTPIVVGNNTHTLVTPFNWDGTSNLVIQTSYSNANTGGTNDNVQMTNSDPGFVSCNYYRADGATSAAILAATTPTGAGNARPNMIVNTNLSCSSPRVAVTATVSASAPLTITGNQTVCNNNVATISVTSNLADYNTYKWSPVTNLFTDAACTIPYVSGNSATTVYVKSSAADTTVYSCTSNNTTTLCSNLATTRVTTLPASITISTPVSDFCLSGTAVISTTPTTGYGSATYQWQSSPNNTTYTDISGANALNYSATGVTSTTYYKLLVKVGTTTCVTSNVQTLTINNPTVLTTTPASRCGAGTVTLGATGSSGTTLSWYANASGGAALGTGTSFTTPLITSTTPFYVAAENYTPGTVTVGTATTTTSSMGITPYGSFYEGARTQYLFTADELRALGMGAGPISGLSFNVTASGGGTFNQEGFTIKMAHTTNATLAAAYGTPSTPFATVYGPIAEPVPAVGLKSYTFTSPFVWDGASNILIDICHDNDINGSCASCYNPASSTVTYTATSFNSVYGSYADNIQSCGVVATSTVNSVNRPNIIFNAQLVCASNRSIVTATVTSAPAVTMTAGSTVCNNSINTLSVTSTISDYNTYKWSPVANLYTDPAATVAYVSGTSATTVYFKSSTAGSVTYTVTGTQTSGSLCSNIASATMTVLPASITLSSSPAQLCFTGTVTISSSPNSGLGTAVFQWKSSPDSLNFTTISGANSTSYTTPTLTSTMFYKYEVKAGSNTCLEPVIKIKVNTPAVTNTTPASRCATGTVVLGATSSSGANLNWYTASTGGASIATGASFTTPSISATTTYYVAANQGGGTSSVGLVDNNASNGTFGSPGGSGYGLYFTTTTGMTIVSVYVYPQTAGTCTIELQDGAGILIPGQQYIANFAAGDIGIKTLVNLNFVIPSAGSYRLMNTAGTAYLGRFNPYNGSPYPLTYANGTVTLTQGSLGTTTYYSFFDWLVSTGCESARTAVVATVNANPAAVVVSPNSFTQCTNSPAKKLTATGGVGAGTYVWTPTTGLYTDAAATTAYTGGGKDSVFAQPGSTTKYTATSTNTNNCSSMDTSNIIVNCTLPVSYLNFAGVREAGNNVLRWTTSTEQNNKGFDVERSVDGRTFSSLGFVASKADNGNSNHELSYNFIDNQLTASVYYYRLRQVDLNGKTNYSNTIVIKGDRVNTIKMSGLYPNPATEEITVSIDAPNAEKVVLVVTDIYGKQLMQQQVSVEVGSNNTKLNVANLSSGTYLIKLQSTKTNTSSILKFVKH